MKKNEHACGVSRLLMSDVYSWTILLSASSFAWILSFWVVSVMIALGRENPSVSISSPSSIISNSSGSKFTYGNYIFISEFLMEKELLPWWDLDPG